MKVGDIVKMVDEHVHSEKLPNGEIFYDESRWRGMVVRHVGGCEYQPSSPFSLYDDDDCNNEWEIHWLHNPPNETSFEYGYYLEVISESR